MQLLLVQAWVLSLSARREEAARAIEAAERLGDLSTGPLPDGFSSAEASLTMLRACFPWGDIGAQLENGRRVAELEGPGSPWRPLACWAAGVGLYFRGEPDEADRWFAESASAGGRERAVAGWRGVAGLPIADRRRAGRLNQQRMLAEMAAEFVQDHGIEKAVIGAAPLALGISLAARGKPGEALPLIERGVAFSRTFGQPIQLANALLSQATVLRTLGEHQRAAETIAETRSILESCPDPGILAGRLAALDRPPQIRYARSADQELTQRELRVLKLLHSDLSERDISRELYVSHNTVHSHVRAIYRKLAVSTRAGALERGRQLGLL